MVIRRDTRSLDYSSHLGSRRGMDCGRQGHAAVR